MLIQAAIPTFISAAKINKERLGLKSMKRLGMAL